MDLASVSSSSITNESNKDSLTRIVNEALADTDTVTNVATTTTPKVKSTRLKMTEAQLCQLKAAFQIHPFVDQERRKKLVEECDLTEDQVKRWFYKYRKRQMRKVEKTKKNLVQDAEVQNENVFCVCCASGHQYFRQNYVDEQSAPSPTEGSL